MGLTFIKSLTASGTPAVITFHHGTADVVFDNTYNEYQFQFVNMHPEIDNDRLKFQVNAVGATAFEEAMTTTAFYAYNRNTSGASNLTYDVTNDQQNSDEAYQDILAYDIANDTEGSASGTLTLYDPSNTTYVKHFTAVGNGIAYGSYTVNMYNAGYINTTDAIDEISFKFDSGNIDAGTIYMYGVS